MLKNRKYLSTAGGFAFSRQRIVTVSHKKTLILAHFCIEKGHAVSAVTMDNSKMLSQQERIKGGRGHCAMTPSFDSPFGKKEQN